MEVVQYCASKKRLFLLGLAFFIIMCVSGIYSLTDEIKKTENTLSTSYVDIELKEFNGNNEPFSEDGKIVLPGEEIELVPRVNNLGIECYLRVKITYTIENEIFNEVDYINGNYSSWEKKDEYYYYDSVLGKGESIDLFNKVSIPDNLSNEYQGKEVKVHIIVDAIQEKNFDGDWNNVEILESIEKTYDFDDSGSSTVIYENGSENHVKTDDGFFDNLGGLLPGDSVSEKVTILNSSKNINNYYLNIENDLSDDEKELLEEFKMVIKDGNGKEVLSTNLSDTEKHLLGCFDASEGDTYTIEILLPKKANNKVSKLLAKLRWNFSLEVLSYGEEIPKNPMTGDFKFDLSLTVFLFSALGLLIVLILERRNKEKEN